MSERINPLKTVVSDDEDAVIDHLCDFMGVTRSAFTRLAVMHYANEQLTQLSNWDEMIARVRKGRK